MTGLEAVTRLRTYLDEAQVGFYTNEELLSALNDGLIETAKLLGSIYKAKRKVNPYEKLPAALEHYITQYYVPVLYVNQFPLPDGVLFLVNVLYSVNGAGNQKPCYERATSEQEGFEQQNTFLQSTSTAPYYYLRDGNIWFESGITGTGAASLQYVATPSEMSSTNETMNCTDSAANTVIQYAYSVILRKDLRAQESLAEFEKFLGMAKQLYL